MCPYILNGSRMIKKSVITKFLRDNLFYHYSASDNSSETDIKL